MQAFGTLSWGRFRVGFLSFAGTRAGDEVAPFPVVRGIAMELLK